MQAIRRPAEKKVPPPDTKKKRKSDDEFTKIYMKQSEGLNNLAQRVETLVANNNAEPANTVAPDPIVTAIQFALTKVNDEEKFNCMLDVLQYIKENYMKK